MTKKQASIELIVAGVLWGFGFVATVWALRSFTPLETTVYRFVLATILGEALYLIFRGPQFRSAKADLFLALPAGVFLGGLLLTQTIGLKYTTATKSGFITSLYVILVPLLSTLFFRVRLRWFNYALAISALIGTYILMDSNLSDVNVGDLWTLACSVMASIHIIYIGRVSGKIGNAFRFNNFQSLWILLIVAPLLFTQDHITVNTSDIQSWLGLLSLGICSSIIAFYLQIRSQRVLSDTTASMLFLLESPFAALFGFWLLNERLSLFQAFGALIILASAMAEIFVQHAKTK